MKVTIPGEKIFYEFSFHRNEFNSTTVVAKKGFNDKELHFLGSATAECSLDDQFCKDCGRKHALEQLFSQSIPNPLLEGNRKGSRKKTARLLKKEDLFRVPLVPRHHRAFIWDTYRTLTKKPRWDSSLLKIKDSGSWTIEGLKKLIEFHYFDYASFDPNRGRYILQEISSRLLRDTNPQVFFHPTPVKAPSRERVGKAISTILSSADADRIISSLNERVLSRKIEVAKNEAKTTEIAESKPAKAPAKASVKKAAAIKKIATAKKAVKKASKTAKVVKAKKRKPVK